MHNRNIIIILLLLVVFPVYGELQLGASAGSNKWGYAGEHNAIVTAVKPAEKYEITAEISFPLPDKDNPLPRESWFGIYTENPGTKSRFLAGMFNPGKSTTPQKPTSIIIGYEKGGEMQKSVSDTIFELKKVNHFWLRMTIANDLATLEHSTDGSNFQPMLNRKVIPGYAPTRIGVVTDGYSSDPVMAITYHALKIKTEQENRALDFNEKNIWEMRSSTGITNVISPATQTATPVTETGDNQIFYNVAASKIDATGTVDVAKTLQQLLDGGRKRLFFPTGTYALSHLKLPENSYLKFAAGATLKIMTLNNAIAISGNNVTIDGATFDLNMISGNVVSGKNVAALRFLNLMTSTWTGTATGKEPLLQNKQLATLIKLESCRDIELEGGSFANLKSVIDTRWCSRVVVKNNKAERCHILSFFGNGSEFLQHYGNWSRNVKYQCMWWGGDCNDSPEKRWVPKNSARIVKRNIKPGQSDYEEQTAGTYDILVQNNFAEYGTTLAWGSKGRNIVISGNIARYMADLAYDTEGGENVVIANNISINSKCAGIGCYFYGERLLISGNQIMTLNEGEDEYKGGFIRLHSPGNSQHFGNGEVTVTGNQFINETDKMRSCGIEAARRVLFKGNTFKNGSIHIMSSADDVVISDCTFDNNLPTNNTAIKTEGGGKGRIIQNNIFRHSGPNAPVNEPAIALNIANNSPITVQGNMMEGWNCPLSCNNSAAPSQLRIVGNCFSGKPIITGPWRIIDKYNVNE